MPRRRCMLQQREALALTATGALVHVSTLVEKPSELLARLRVRLRAI